MKSIGDKSKLAMCLFYECMIKGVLILFMYGTYTFNQRTIERNSEMIILGVVARRSVVRYSGIPRIVPPNLAYPPARSAMGLEYA